MDGLAIEDHPWDKFINVHGSEDTEYLGDTAESFATIQPPKQLEHQQQDTTTKTAEQEEEQLQQRNERTPSIPNQSQREQELTTEENLKLNKMPAHMSKKQLNGMYMYTVLTNSTDSKYTQLAYCS
jgi:hypothetical protein